MKISHTQMRSRKFVREMAALFSCQVRPGTHFLRSLGSALSTTIVVMSSLGGDAGSGKPRCQERTGRVVSASRDASPEKGDTGDNTYTSLTKTPDTQWSNKHPRNVS